MGISISNRQKQVAIATSKIRRAAKKILEDLECGDHELSVVFLDDPTITQLNHQYFGRKRPTNVIAFPLTAGDKTLPSLRLLGDVVISAETARSQAKEAGVRVQDEILFLLIHGILHLVGYDHEGAAAERMKMERKERELFKLIAHR